MREEIGGTAVEKMAFAREHGLTGQSKIDAKMTDEQIAQIPRSGSSHRSVSPTSMTS